MHYHGILESLNHIDSFQHITITDRVLAGQTQTIECLIDNNPAYLEPWVLGINKNTPLSSLLGTYTYQANIGYFIKQTEPMSNDEPYKLLYLTQDKSYLVTEPYVLIPLKQQLNTNLKDGFYWYGNHQYQPLHEPKYANSCFLEHYRHNPKHGLIIQYQGKSVSQNPGWRAFIHGQLVWLDPQYLIIHEKCYQSPFLQTIHIDYSGITSFGLAQKLADKLEHLHQLTLDGYTFHDQTLIINPNKDNTLSFTQDERIFCGAMLDFFNHFMPSVYLAENQWPLFFALKNLHTFGQASTAQPTLIKHNGICFKFDLTHNWPNHVVEIFKQKKKTYLGDHVAGVATSIHAPDYPKPGFYYVQNQGNKRTQYHRLNDTPLTQKIAHLGMHQILMALDQSTVVTITKHAYGLNVFTPSLMFSLPRIDDTLSTLHETCKPFNKLKTHFKLLAFILKRGKENTEYRIEWDNHLDQLHRTNFEVINAFTPQSHALSSRVLNRLTLPTALLLSAIFVATNVISIPTFVMALTTASILGVLVLQITIYQNHALKPNASFIHNPWVSHNSVAFGLAGIAYWSLIATPIAAYIAVTVIMTLAPLGSMMHSHGYYGLFAHQVNTERDDFLTLTK